MKKCILHKLKSFTSNNCMTMGSREKLSRFNKRVFREYEATCEVVRIAYVKKKGIYENKEAAESLANPLEVAHSEPIWPMQKLFFPIKQSCL